MVKNKKQPSKRTKRSVLRLTPSCCAVHIMESPPDAPVWECPTCHRAWRNVNGTPVAWHDPAMPAYYASHKVTPIDLIVEYRLGFALGNVIKYTARAAEKHGVEDLRKALWYLVFELTGDTGKANEVSTLVGGMLDS